MKNKYIFVLVLLVCIAVAGLGLTTAYDKQQDMAGSDDLQVVTSFYPMYIATMNVIGDAEGVELSNLSEPQTGCLHDYQLTPEDMKLLSTADVFVVNGGGIETFLADVAEEYPDLTIIYASEGIELYEGNPHVWMNPALYSNQVHTIAHGLSEAVLAQKDADTVSNEALAAVFENNAHDYMAQIDVLIQQIASMKNDTQGEPIISLHEAYGYVANAYGMMIAGEMNLDEERQISAGEVADMLRLIEENGVDLILAEELYGKSMCDTIQAEADVEVLYLDPITRGEYEATAYIKAMQANIDLIHHAFHEH